MTVMSDVTHFLCCRARSLVESIHSFVTDHDVVSHNFIIISFWLHGGWFSVY